MSLEEEDFTPPPVRENLLWLAVDLDGTLASSTWYPGLLDTTVGPPLWENIIKLRKAVAEGWKVVIHTSRPWSDYEMIELWLKHHDIPFRSIVCGKLLAYRYIDDRAIPAHADRWF